MSDRVLSAVLTAEEAARDLPMAPIVYFFIAFGLFVVLLGVTWSFRNTANKLSRPEGSEPWHGHASIETDGTHN